MELTKEQKEAVTSVTGNVVTIASAGSGKTSAFVTRIAYMIKASKISPANILAVTFTKKASEEMKKRLDKTIGKEKADKVEMGTFHSICYKLLREMDSDFAKLKIAPDWWRFGLLNDICKAGSDKNPNGLNLGIRAGELSSFISYQKSNGIQSSENVLMDDNVSYVDYLTRDSLQQAYITYEKVKEGSRQIDFDDMLLYMYKKLKTDDGLRKKIKDRYKFIMIDEFQDTSKIVIDIVKMINEENVFVVGDFRQSIYKFINANVENILNFKNTFNNVKVIELNKNFRSTQSIVKLSNDIINHSPIKKYKEYKPSESVSEIGEKVKFTLYEREGVQIDRIADEIVSLKENGSSLKEIAVLVRTNVQTATIEEVLTELDIPFEISKSTSFFDRKEIVDILSYARLASETSDDASFRRVYNVPNRFLSKQSLEKLDKFSSEKDIPLFNGAKTTPQNSDWKFKRGMDSLINIVEEIKFQVSTNVNAGRVLKNIVKLTGYKDFINNAFTNESQVDERIEAVDKICEMASKFPTINAFLAHILKIKEKQNKSKGGDAVQIITMHSAKGLEWDNVFVIDCDSELMPHQMNDDVEEERRLFYVACSRPRKRLYISWLLYVGSERLKEGQFIRELLGEDRINEMKKEIFRGSKESVCFY